MKGALATAGFPLLLNASFSRRARAETKPNILLIMVDDLPLPAVRHLTKTLAKVRDPGMGFPNTFAVSPVCGPSRASLLTGRYVHNHQILENRGAGKKMISTGLHADSIATRLKAQGYATGMFGKFQNNHPAGNVPQGWDRFVLLHEPHNQDEYLSVAIDGKHRRISRKKNNETRWIGEMALTFLRNQPETAPWFCYVAPHSPHSPSHAAAGNRRQADRVSLYSAPARSEGDLSDKPLWVRKKKSGSRRVLRGTYQGMVAESLDVDDLVGEIVDYLARTGKLQNTYVVFTNDNGYAFGEHDLQGKNHPYDEATKLPLFIRGPGIAAGATSERLVSLVDVTATVVDWAGGTWDDLDGRSLRPLLSGAQVPWRSRLLVENFMHYTWRIVRDDRYAYIRDDPSGFEQLYDMVEDPYQMRSISSDPAAASVMEQKRAQLAALRDAGGPGLRAAEA